MSDAGEQYNARRLTPEGVAASFVAPPQFAEILSLQNSVLVGSRGSGKTTLLRMLEPRAQIEWRARGNVDQVLPAVGIFVPIDASWLASLRNAYRCEGVSDWTGVALAVYTLTVARAVLDGMIYRLKQVEPDHPYFARLARVAEDRLVSELERIFLSTSKCRTLVELRFRLTAQIGALPRDLSHLSQAERVSFIAHLADPVSLAATACELFSQAAGDEGRQWMLLCDELEIAPADVNESLFRALRATPTNLILKLAMTPVVRPLVKQTGEQPLPANDFDIVSLAYSTREEGFERKAKEVFCTAIWKQLVDERFGGVRQDVTNPYRVLEEPNVFGASRRRGMKPLRAPYGRERYSEMFDALASIDPSFMNYLVNKDVDPRNLEACTPEQFDAVVRKVAPIVEIRLFYLRPQTGRQVQTSRRSSSVYAGARRIFDISEGHPRWLKANLGRMLARMGDNGRITLAVQAAELSRSVDRLSSRIAAFPSGVSRAGSTQQVIQQIGSYFASQVIGPSFKADPYLSFVVDEAAGGEIIGAIENALYIGALVPMAREPGGLLEQGIVGRRLRLSYWLSPRFKLPLITGKPIALSSILSQFHDGPKLDHPQLGLPV